MALAVFTSIFTACGGDENDATKDMETPKIVETGITANPIDCQVYAKGDVIHFEYLFTDNIELGNYNIEIHHNFDHHTHGTSATTCPLEPKITDKNLIPKNAWVYNHTFAIPAGSKRFLGKTDIIVPETIAPGDYHFMIKVTDQSGWPEYKSMSIKIKK